MSVHSKKKSQRNCHGLEELKETWWLKVMWCPGWISGTEKGHLGKIKESE